MSASEFPDLTCPSCVEPLEAEGTAWLVCSRCRGRFEVARGVPDLRQHPGDEVPPTPATAPELERALTALEAGTPFKDALDALLLDLDEDAAERLMLEIQESRGAWTPLLETTGGSALLVTNALSGTLVPLAFAGYSVTLLDLSVPRLCFARAKAEAHIPSKTRVVAGGDAQRLPFSDGSFDLVVQEDGLPTPATGWGHDFDELARVARTEIVLTAGNRLAYKHSLGRRGEFRVPAPFAFVRQALRPAREELTLAGYKSLFASANTRTRAFSLYPHARDYSHVVALDAPRPALTIGPKEKRNVVKLAARALGLFPVLTPSFAIFGSRAPQGTARLERVLAALAEIIDEPTPEPDVLVATRSNTVVVHTSLEATPQAVDPDVDPAPAGRWTLHVPLSPQKRKLCAGHHGFLGHVRENFPSVPVPEPLFSGELEGVWLTCERRLPGLTAPHLTGNLSATRRMFTDAARHMASLVVEPNARMDEELFETVLGARFRIVREHAAVESTKKHLDRLLAEARERVLGEHLPLVLYHADLRSKHVQVRPDGSVLGYLDWGASLERFLPFVDLVHLVAHQRKQEEGCDPSRTWQLVRERKELVDHEREAFEDYLGRTGLSEAVRGAIELVYPVLVAGMAELNWDYSRPRWLHQQFGV